MRYIFLLTGCLLYYFSGAQLVINDPNAQLIDVPKFHSISASGGVHLLISKGQTQAVAVSFVSVEKGAAVVAEVKNGVLHIYPSSQKNKLRGKAKTLRAYISYSTLDKIDVSGAVAINFVDNIREDRLDIKLSGASKITANVTISRLNINMSGASNAILEGAVQELNLICSGASDFKSYHLTANRATVVASGASDVQLTAENFLKVNATGASDVFYKGNPETEIETNGASQATQKN